MMPPPNPSKRVISAAANVSRWRAGTFCVSGAVIGFAAAVGEVLVYQATVSGDTLTIEGVILILDSFANIIGGLDFVYTRVT